MPIFDFTVDARLPDVRDTFWLYWAVTIPVTLVTLAGYVVFQVVTDRRRLADDDGLLDDKWELGKSMGASEP